MASVYLYPEAREQFPELPPHTVAALEHKIQGHYRARRLDVIWRCSQSLQNFRYPQPYPAPAQAWTPSIVDERPQVSLLHDLHLLRTFEWR